MNTSVILPSYNPNQKLIETVNGLAEVGFNDIIIINDGSSIESAFIFDELGELPYCTILHHGENRGKGRGLKTGFEYFLSNRSEKSGVVTVDDDGQHRAADVLGCARAMEETGASVLGTRNFKDPRVPLKSRFGNKLTSLVFRFFFGIMIKDTQTGLRALPLEYIKILYESSGERYEYETNMLLSMKENNLFFFEYPIETIYDNNNKNTRFKPVRDSVMIYTVILKFMLSSLSCSLIDISVFTALNLLLLPLFKEAERVFIASAAARVISSLINFAFNRKKVFKSNNRVYGAILRYYTLCAAQLLCSYVIVLCLSLLFGAEKSLWQSLIKIITDTLLFFISFKIQSVWVFSKQHERKKY